MVNDHLSDFVTRIRNGYMGKKKDVVVPNVILVLKVAEVLKKSGYISAIKREDGKVLAELKYNSKKPAISGIERVSKPGARIYSSVNRLPRVLGGLGMHILTTPNGVLSDKEARKLNSGGEVIVKVW